MTVDHNLLFKILVPIGDQKDNFNPLPRTGSWYKGCVQNL